MSAQRYSIPEAVVQRNQRSLGLAGEGEPVTVANAAGPSPAPLTDLRAGEYGQIARAA